jgi:hypothetical protein
MGHERSAWWLTIAVALAAGWWAVRSDALQPLPPSDGPVTERALGTVRAAAAAVDAACQTGDLAAFAARTTAAHRARLDQRLALLDRRLDAETLAAQAVAGHYRTVLDRAPWAGAAAAGRVVVAVPRPAGDGAQVLVFEWDGERLRLDASWHQPTVRDAPAASAAVEAVLRGER